jgi:NAD(P)-dependent dehydrogenase (short-subunit alcohol dehydrogenase family)
MAQHLSGPASLAGQVALITGGSGGMGRAIATLRQRGGHRAGCAFPVFRLFQLDHRNIVGYQRRHVDGLK